jgi:hypothetical protein
MDDTTDRDATIQAGVDALNQFDPSDWSEGWVSALQIVVALYDAMLLQNRINKSSFTLSSEFRFISPAYVREEMFRTRR